MNLSGGKTRDGGSMVGGSVFYAAEAQETISENKPEDAIEHLDKELQESEQRRIEAERLEEQLSSYVWICTSTLKMSKVTVIDANNPAEILQAFNVCQSHLLCIASVPGAKESDYILSATDAEKIDDHAEIALSEELSQAEAKIKEQSDASPSKKSEEAEEPQNQEIDVETENLGRVRFVKTLPDASLEPIDEVENDEKTEEEEEDSEDTPIEKMSSVQPTMWLGAQDGYVFVHSAVANWSVCLHSVKLQDAALGIV